MVELATAMLIVNGGVGLVLSAQALGALAADVELSPLLVGLSIGIGVLSIALGLALRAGRWWLFGLNAVAVAGFLELTSFTVTGLLAGAVDVFVVVVLLVYRPWFAWRPDGPDDEDDDVED
jgi:hypothetical protein